MRTPSPLQVGGRLIHLGPPKTGTTAIQASLHASREALAAYGIRVLPADRPRDWQAGLTLFGGTRPGTDYVPDLAWWERFADEVRSTQGTLVISNEAFAKADEAGVARLVRDIGCGKAHYLYVARRFDRLLLSHWQESIKGGTVRPDLETWLSEVAESASTEGFWRHNDISGVSERYLAHIAPDDLTILVAEDGDRGQLRRVFEEFLQVPPGTLQAPDATVTNRSLSLNEIELIRRLNQIGQERSWSPADRRFLIKRGLVNEFEASPRRPGDRAISVPQVHRQWIDAESARRVAVVTALQERGVRVVGDLGRLAVPADAYVRDRPDGEELAFSMDAAVDAVVSTVEAARRRKVDEVKVRRRVAFPPSGADAEPPSLLARLRRLARTWS